MSMPLMREGVSPLKSFWYGQLSGLVEPIGGVLGAAFVQYCRPLLPFTMSLAAGARPMQLPPLALATCALRSPLPPRQAR